MKYVNLFDTQAAYDATKKYYPNTSYIEETDEVVYQYEPDYSKEYLTFEALQNGTFTLTVPANVDSTKMTSVAYSTDDGANWVTTTIDNTLQTITTPTINAGDKVLWKGIGSKTGYGSDGGSTFSSTGNYNVYGNLNSIFWGDNFENAQPIGIYSGKYLCVALFRNSVKLVSAKNLILPSFVSTYEQYGNLFAYMFSGCTALTEAPELPATSLRPYVYGFMFNGCTSLTTAPVLPAKYLLQGCYNGMFSACRHLNNITMLAINISASGALSSWVNMVAATGTFTKAASMTTLPTGASGIPSGWTVVNV